MEKKEFKLLSVPDKEIACGQISFDMLEKAFNAKSLFIKNKGRVVAKAEWEGDKLVVTKIRRPAKTSLEVGQVLYESWQPREAPPSPELKTEGHVLVRNKKYSSEQAVRSDPYWQDYEGWFIIPEKINDKDAIERFLDVYPELEDDKQGNKLEKLKLSEIKDKELKMAKFDEVDEYVCGFTDKIPQLHDFTPPGSEDMVEYRAQYCHCGCGNFERWNLYWPNKWIVYVPRKNKIKPDNGTKK